MNGDIVLSGGYEQKPKKTWVIAGIVAFVVIVVSLVVAIILVGANKNKKPEKTVAEEYAEMYDATYNYATDVYNVNNMLKNGCNRGVKLNDFFNAGSLDAFSGSLAKLNEMEGKLAKISYKKVPDELKEAAENLVKVQAPEYFGFTTSVLDNLILLCDNVLKNNVAKIRTFAKENDLSTSVRDGLLAMASGNATNTRDKETMKAVFNALVSAEQLEMMDEFRISMNIVMNNASAWLVDNTDDEAGGDADEVEDDAGEVEDEYED